MFRNANVAYSGVLFVTMLLSTPHSVFAACTVPSDDLVVTQDTLFCAGSYRVRDRAGNNRSWSLWR
jgi:hypothetical protein